MNSLLLGLAAAFVSYLIVDFFCKKLGVDKLIDRKRSIGISLFLIAVLFNIAGISVIENFITKQYQFLLKSFLAGATLSFTVFILPINRTNNKL